MAELSTVDLSLHIYSVRLLNCYLKHTYIVLHAVRSSLLASWLSYGTLPYRDYCDTVNMGNVCMYATARAELLKKPLTCRWRLRLSLLKVQ